MKSGRMFALASVGAVVGVVVLCGAVLAGCGGLLAVFSPVNYFGCGTERPTGITAADLAASYATADGGRLELIADSTVSASGLTNWETWDSSEQDQDPPLSGPGTWSLNPADGPSGDIVLAFTAPPGYGSGFGTSLNIAGSRAEPWLYQHLTDSDSCQLYRLDRV
ncbi:hypothetical protein OG559_16265 [Micromonospora sp. NBC_01405]|uniref:hypothetical protein n=1 Tax=Micromonospora sp. NBC_01405 TaxID=2903589 RepID=UPI003254ADDB